MTEEKKLNRSEGSAAEEALSTDAPETADRDGERREGRADEREANGEPAATEAFADAAARHVDERSPAGSAIAPQAPGMQRGKS
ncbi:MAG: hypothetical protein JWP97_3579 [Labilithrix sp.]|nr:hypothetical protein [Labilithrix sp.]